MRLLECKMLEKEICEFITTANATCVLNLAVKLILKVV